MSKPTREVLRHELQRVHAHVLELLQMLEGDDLTDELLASKQFEPVVQRIGRLREAVFGRADRGVRAAWLEALHRAEALDVAWAIANEQSAEGVDCTTLEIANALIDRAKREGGKPGRPTVELRVRFVRSIVLNQVPEHAAALGDDEIAHALDLVKRRGGRHKEKWPALAELFTKARLLAGKPDEGERRVAYFERRGRTLQEEWDEHRAGKY